MICVPIVFIFLSTVFLLLLCSTSIAHGAPCAFPVELFSHKKKSGFVHFNGSTSICTGMRSIFLWSWCFLCSNFHACIIYIRLLIFLWMLYTLMLDGHLFHFSLSLSMLRRVVICIVTSINIMSTVKNNLIWSKYVSHFLKINVMKYSLGPPE